MNNNNEDQGQRNAATLMRILEARRRARVPKLVAASPQRTAADSVPGDELIEGAAWVTEDASVA
jgi:hypothetical protein